MDIKSRLRSFLTKENDLYSAPNVDPAEATTSGPSGLTIQPEDVREFANDPTPDADVITEIEDVYFNNMDEFDSSQHELDKLPEVLSIDELNNYRNVLRRQQRAVSRELSKKILENQGAYVRELTRVMDLEKNLRNATGICKQGRSNLSLALNEIAYGGLQVLAKNRRKVLLQGILKSLSFIKTLQETDVRLKELLAEGSYANAIQICLEYRKASVSFNQYTCIKEMSDNLLEILEQIKEQLDVALSKLCFLFNEEEYGQIQKAYKLLGNTQIAMDAMLMHFVNTVNKIAIHTLHEVLEEAGIRTSDTHFPVLCNAVPPEAFTSGLIKLCKNFWTVMYSYREMMQWHAHDLTNSQSDEGKVAFAYDAEMTHIKLDQGLARIWQDIQVKVEGYVLSSNFAFFKYDDLIVVLDIVNQLINIGEEFCSKKSQVLQESIRTQTINYFKAYHKSNMEELKMFLENEVWELCPVRETFSFLDLKEFHFMKGHISINKSGSNHNIITSSESFFNSTKFTKLKSPFDAKEKKEATTVYKEEVFYYDDDDDDDDDVPDELKQDYVDENTGEEPQDTVRPKRQRSVLISTNSPIVTNTTLNVLRSFGKYMQMMTVLKPIAFDVVTYMTQLFDYYMYSVFTFFTDDGAMNLLGSLLAHGDTNRSYGDNRYNGDNQMNVKLESCLSRIFESIILKDGFESEGSSKVVAPSLSVMVDLHNSQTLHGFTHKLIGVESLIFLSKQLKMVYHNLDSWIPINKQPFLAQFYGKTVDIVKEMRTPVFRTITDNVIEYERVLQMMSTVKWDVKVIMSEHSPYVNSLAGEYQRLQGVIHSFGTTVPLPPEALLEFWRNVVLKTNQIFVEGFSSTKKCSNEGRALMLLDFQNFAIKVEGITGLKPIPGREYVVNYINAFYLSEAALEEWLKEHQEYTQRQLRNLITCGTGSHIGKKMKEKFLGLLSEVEGSTNINKGGSPGGKGSPGNK